MFWRQTFADVLSEAESADCLLTGRKTAGRYFIAKWRPFFVFPTDSSQVSDRPISGRASSRVPRKKNV